MTNSCFVKKLRHYIDLDECTVALLQTLEEQQRSYPRHHEIVSEGDTIDHLFIVKSGWLYNYVDMPDGRRQLTRVLLPGDVVGFPDLAFDVFTSCLRTAEDVQLCPFPKRKLDVIFEQTPRVTALLFTLANREMCSLVDTIRALGRMSARERLWFFFLDTHSRLRVTNPGLSDTIRLPLNQHEIGDLLGLTHTYVSKTIRRMEDDGAITRNGNRIQLNRIQPMKERIGFVDRYSAVDTSWFPLPTR